jgi:IS4 transposase
LENVPGAYAQPFEAVMLHAITAAMSRSLRANCPDPTSCEHFLVATSVSQGARAMVFDKVFDAFIKESPVSVMFRGTLENIFSADRINDIFSMHAIRQQNSKVLFSTCADMLSLVVLGSRKSLHAEYVAQRANLAASVTAIYGKIARIEPQVCEHLVRDTAADCARVIEELGALVKGPLPGFEVRILDGNHLAGTDHRIAELRRLGAAALPGQSLVILDPQRQLLVDAIPCEDGHTNERKLIPAVIERVQAKQCWIGDSAFCTLAFMSGMRDRQAYFLIRQHGGFQGELVGKRKKIGRCSTGEVYEQAVRIDNTGTEARRITIVRDKPTQKGEREVHLLTNLPAKVSAVKAAEAYLDRWQVETAFQDLATTLRSEINTLGYPKAALFGFCLALVLFNVLSVVKAALRVAAKGDAEKKLNLSTYYLADEISGVWRGMKIAIADEHWEATFAALTPKQLAAKLRWLAAKVDLRRFYTNPWTPKRPQPKRKSGQRGNHVSTFRILQERAQRPAKAAGTAPN